MIDVEEELATVLNFNIAKELLKQINNNLSDGEILDIFEKCQGNPFNAPILYQLLKNENDRTN